MLMLEKDFDMHPSRILEFSAGEREKVKIKDLFVFFVYLYSLN